MEGKKSVTSTPPEFSLCVQVIVKSLMNDHLGNQDSSWWMVGAKYKEDEEQCCV